MRKLARILRVSVTAGAFLFCPGIAAKAVDSPTVPDQVTGANESVPVPGVPEFVPWSWRPPWAVPASEPARSCHGGARGPDRLEREHHTRSNDGFDSPRELDRPADPGPRCFSSRERPNPRHPAQRAGNDRREGDRNDPAHPPVPDRNAGHLAPAPSEPRREADHAAPALVRPEPRRTAENLAPVVHRQGGVDRGDLLGENRQLAEPASGVDLSPLAGYGVVGMLAALGLVFATRQWLVSERERKALSDRADALSDKLLDQAERHKAELLDIFRAVGPGLQSMAATLTEYREFLAQQRMDNELERARRKGARGGR